MPTIPILAILIALAAIGFHAWVAYRTYRAAPTRRPRAATGPSRPVPAAASGWEGSLRALGFRRVGEIELDLPADSMVPFVRGRGQQTHTSWIYVDPHGNTSASLMEGMVELSTQLADGTFIETMFPIGHNDTRPGLLLRHVTSSVEDAYRQHSVRVGGAELLYGNARPVDTMSAFLRQDAEFRERHAHAVLRRPFAKSLLPMAVSVVAAAVVLATMLLGRGG